MNIVNENKSKKIIQKLGKQMEYGRTAHNRSVTASAQ